MIHNNDVVSRLDGVASLARMAAGAAMSAVMAAQRTTIDMSDNHCDFY